MIIRTCSLTIAALALGLTALASPASAQNAGASGVKVNKHALEKVQWYKAPIQLQLVDENPRLTDHRGGPAEATVFVPIPAAPAAPAPAAQLLPGAGIASGGSLPVRMAPGALSNLPRSGFASNIPASTVVTGTKLPRANSTGLLSQKDWQKPVRESGVKTKPAVAAGSRPAPAPAVFTYRDGYQGQGARTGSSTQTMTSVSGQITGFGRGSLLSK